MKPLDRVMVSKENMLDEILLICKQHKEEKRALAFAFLFYDFKDAAIAKVLKDEDWLASLDQIAGKYLTIFYIDSKEGQAKKQRGRAYSRTEGPPPGMFGYMTAVSLLEPYEEKDQRKISERLGIKQDLDTPFMLFFQTDGNSISDYFFVSLKKERMEDSFLELKSHIQAAVESLADVREENFHNHQGIFNLIEAGVKKGKINKFISENIFTKTNLTTFVKFILSKIFL